MHIITLTTIYRDFAPSRRHWRSSKVKSVEKSSSVSSTTLRGQNIYLTRPPYLTAGRTDPGDVSETHFIACAFDALHSVISRRREFHEEFLTSFDFISNEGWVASASYYLLKAVWLYYVFRKNAVIRACKRLLRLGRRLAKKKRTKIPRRTFTYPTYNSRIYTLLCARIVRAVLISRVNFHY